MQIEVARIPSEGLDVAGTDEAVFAGPAEDVDYTALGPVEYDLHADYASGALIVTGSLSVKMRFSCSRCAIPFENAVSDGRFDFVAEAPDGSESVDLTEGMREAILCAFPSYPVCRNDCKGLCAQCGKDLNAGECGCVPKESNRWEDLSGLKL